MNREQQNAWIRQNAPPDQVAPTIQALARGGLDTLQTHMRETQQTRRQEITSNADVRRQQIQSNQAVQEAQIRAQVDIERARMGLPPLQAPLPQYTGPAQTPPAPAPTETFWQKHGDTVMTVGALGGVGLLIYFATRPAPAPPSYDDPRDPARGGF